MSISPGGTQDSPLNPQHLADQVQQPTNTSSSATSEKSTPINPKPDEQNYTTSQREPDLRIPELSSYSEGKPIPQGAQEAFNRVISSFCSSPVPERAQERRQTQVNQMASVFAQCFHIDGHIDKEHAFVVLANEWSCQEILGESCIDDATKQAFISLYKEVFGKDISPEQAQQMLTPSPSKMEVTKNLQSHFKKQFLSPLPREMQARVEDRLNGIWGEGGNSSADVIREFNKLVEICVIREMSPAKSAGYIEGKLLEYLSREGNQGSQAAVKAGINVVRKTVFKEAFLASMPAEYRQNVDAILAGKRAKSGYASADIIKRVNRTIDMGMERGWSPNVTIEKAIASLDNYSRIEENRGSQGAVEAAKEILKAMFSGIEENTRDFSTPQTTATAPTTHLLVNKEFPQKLSIGEIKAFGDEILKDFSDQKGVAKTFWANTFGLGSSTKQTQDLIKQAVSEAVQEGDCTRTELWKKIYDKIRPHWSAQDPLHDDAKLALDIIHKVILPEVKYDPTFYYFDEKDFGVAIALKMDEYRKGVNKFHYPPLKNMGNLLKKMEPPYDLEKVVEDTKTWIDEKFVPGHISVSKEKCKKRLERIFLNPTQD